MRNIFQHETGLRQEMKGMTVNGSTRSCSRRSSKSPLKSTAPSTPRSPTSGTATPHARSDTSDAAEAITTPRSLSNTSSLNRDTHDRGKTTSNSSSGIIVDTRSKTLSTANHNHLPSGDDVMNIMANHGKKNTSSLVARSKALTNASHNHQPSGEEIMDIMANHGKKNTSSLPAPPTNNTQPTTNSGYGKPLVTSLNKRLTIRRDYPRELPSPTNNDKLNSRSKNTAAKYPIKSWKAENGKSISPDRNTNQDVITSRNKQPIKGNIFGNKLRSSNPNVKPDTKITMLKHNVVAKPYSSSSSITKSLPNKSPTRMAKSMEGKPQEKFKTIKSDFHRDIKNWNPETRRSPTRPLINRMKPPSGTKKPSLDPVRKSSAPLRDMLNEKIKQPLFKDIPVPSNIASVLSRQSSTMHSNRSFKPQLEDIKSSYLLLNKKSPPQNIGDMNGRRHKAISIPAVPKPKPLNENVRREQLHEIKKKFQSRQFLNNSKYDKIEGLNWISWK